MGGKFKIKKQLSKLDWDAVNVSAKHSFGCEVMEVKSMTKSAQQSVPVGIGKLLNGGKHTYKLPSAEESARMSDKDKENVTDRFNDMVNRMNR